MTTKWESLLDSLDVLGEPIDFARRANQPDRWRRITLSLLVVALSLYLPFSWLPGSVTSESPGTLQRIGFVLILPGTFAAYFVHNSESASNVPLCFTVMAITTVLLVGGLTWLGMPGWRARFGAAILALIVSLPTSLLLFVAVHMD